MIPQEYRFTLETEPRYHGWENTGWDADGVLHLGSSLHPGHLGVDMAGGKVLFRAEDPATADMLADVFDTPPDEAYPCTPDSLKETLTAMAGAMSTARQAPPETESEATVKQRRHQQLYREGQLDLWGHACAVTGCALPELLVASHAKPWAASSPAERLDPYNGFPLEARYDRLFDQGLITFTDAGSLVLSSALDAKDRALLNLHEALHLRRTPTARHLPYLHYHRQHIFIP